MANKTPDVRKKHAFARHLTAGMILSSTLGTGCYDPDFFEAVVESPPEIWKKNSERFSAPLEWGDCPDGFSGACAWLEVPVDWLDLRSDSLKVMLSRRSAKDPRKAKGSFWLLDGGPGSNAHGFVQRIERVWPKLLDDYNVYTIVHRGAFHSERLSCASAESSDSPGGSQLLAQEAESCVKELQAEWGDDLGNFRTTHAARDLSHAIRRTRAPMEELFVYAHSYGTLVAQRFAQLAPHQATGIILDGVLAPEGVSYFDFDLQHNQVAEKLAKACASDAYCASKWGEDVWGDMGELKQRLQAGHCQDLGMKPSQLSGLTGRMVAAKQSRTDIFALMYRINRCSDADVEVVKHYFNTLQQLQSEGAKSWDPRRFSTALFYNIVFSESTLAEVPSIADVERRCENALFCPGLSENARRIYDHWPRYEQDRFRGKPTTFAVPVLAMTGTLDPQTPVEPARAVGSSFRGVSQTFVEFPNAPHGLWSSSAVKEPGELNCAGQLVSQFLKDPSLAIDTGCVKDLVGLDFKGDPQRNKSLFGTKDAWEGELESSVSARTELSWADH